MAVHIPFAAHGRCRVAVVCFAGQQRRAYHLSETIGEEESWAIRDYLGGEILRSADSTKRAADLRRLVTFAAEAEYRAVGHLANWAADCKAAADRYYGSAHVDTGSLNNGTLGIWRRMNRSGS